VGIPVSVVLAVVLAVSLIVEWFRYLLFSSVYAADPDLWFISAGAIALNLSFHRWLLPETIPKVIVSATLMEAGLPVVYHLLRKIGFLIAKELIVSPKGTD